MIDFRYHLVSIVAIFFALAIGIALGAGPLQGRLTEGLVSQATQDRIDREQLRAEVLAAQDELEFADDYASGTAGAVLAAELAGRTVSLVPLPGSDPGDVRAVGELVASADGTVVSTVSLTAAVLDPANRQLADGLARRVLDGASGTSQPDAAGSYQLLGAAFARAFLTRDADPAPQDNDANSIEAAFVEAGFIGLDGAADRRAQLALVIAGDPVEDAADGAAEVAAEVAAALDADSLGVVVAGTAASADGGAVGAVRSSAVSNDVSSVDSVDLPAGRVATVLAVAEQSRGGVGHYGSGDTDDGAVPTGAAGG